MKQISRGAIWVTRAEPGASSTSEQLKPLGFTPLIGPLLTICSIEAVLTLQPQEVLAFTSSTGVEYASALTSERGMSVFAVGATTAEAARVAGFDRVISADSDVAGLARLIIESKPAGVVHASAEVTAGDLIAVLAAAGITARKVAVYRADAATTLPAPIAEALDANRLLAALFHSPRAAQTALGLLSQNAFDLGQVSAFGLSPACVEPLRGRGFKSLISARAPTDQSLLTILDASLAP